jgi:hypothetical protein
MTFRITVWVGLALFGLALGGCTTQTIRSTQVEPVAPALTHIPDELLLDVNIAVFDPGIDNLDPKKTTTTPGIRRAEGHYVAQRIKDTLETAQQWGTVRVVPQTGREIDVMVAGKILKSDGQTLKIEVEVVDASGTRWFRRNYKESVSRFAYDAEIRRRQEPFQNVYTRLANDMRDYLTKRDLSDLRSIRATTEVRFAERFAPAAFADYLNRDGGGVATLKRLPANDDPLLQRIRQIRVRDQMFIDNLQENYDAFDRSMGRSYDYWREESYSEADAERELKSQALIRTLGGALAVIGGILAQTSGNQAARTAGVIGIAGGAYAFKSGLDKNAEARIHTAAMKELSDSLNAEVQPQTIALTDRTIELSGTVDEQYAQWQALLQEIYLIETGQTEGAQQPPTETGS